MDFLYLVHKCPGDLDFRLEGQSTPPEVRRALRENSLKLHAPYDLSFELSGMSVLHKADTMTDYYRLMRPFVSRSIISGHTRCGFDTPTVSAQHTYMLPFPDHVRIKKTKRPEYLPDEGYVSGRIGNAHGFSSSFRNIQEHK